MKIIVTKFNEESKQTLTPRWEYAFPLNSHTICVVENNSFIYAFHRVYDLKTREEVDFTELFDLYGIISPKDLEKAHKLFFIAYDEDPKGVSEGKIKKAPGGNNVFFGDEECKKLEFLFRKERKFGCRYVSMYHEGKRIDSSNLTDDGKMYVRKYLGFNGVDVPDLRKAEKIASLYEIGRGLMSVAKCLGCVAVAGGIAVGITALSDATREFSKEYIADVKQDYRVYKTNREERL